MKGSDDVDEQDPAPIDVEDLARQCRIVNGFVKCPVPPYDKFDSIGRPQNRPETKPFDQRTAAMRCYTHSNRVTKPIKAPRP